MIILNKIKTRTLLSTFISLLGPFLKGFGGRKKCVFYTMKIPIIAGELVVAKILKYIL